MNHSANKKLTDAAFFAVVGMVGVPKLADALIAPDPVGAITAQTTDVARIEALIVI